MNKKVLILAAAVFLVVAITSAILLTQKQSSALKTSAKEVGIHAIVYKSPTCGCCTQWEKHLKANGFIVDSRPRDDMDTIKKDNHVTRDLASCHTALIGGYVVEGHVPAADIKRLINEKPQNVVGISAPGMPMGSPGMEGPYNDKYDVVSFDENGKTSVFASH